MTSLDYTVFRVGNIGGKRYVIGLHPNLKETLVSIRQLGRRTPYVVTLSRVRVEAALAFGRAELAAKREARKNGIPWQKARRIFFANLLPPRIKQPRNERTK